MCTRYSTIQKSSTFILIILQVFFNVQCEDCISREYSSDSIVCVCNSTYCDTIPKVRPPIKGNYLMYVSTQAGQRFKRTVGSFKDTQQVQGVKLTLDKETKYQEIIGFGAAFTDSAGINLLSLQPSTQDVLLKAYYSPEGLEYNLGRVPIGGTDFSTRGYTYSDHNDDASLSGFNLTSEDFHYKIPVIKRAQLFSSHQLKLFASCWSPPAWMKTNHKLTGFGVLKQEYYRAYANYYVKFLDAYKQEGLKFWCITTGNEPVNGLLWFNKINALGWTALSQRQWIAENLGPSIQATHPDTCIIVGDDQRYIFPWWIKTIMDYKNATQYINGSGVHWYWDFIVPPVLLKKTHDMFPDLFIINTESSYGDKPWDMDKVALGSWKRATDYASDIIASLNNWVVGWIDWNFALDEKGGPNYVNNYVDAAVIVNKTSDEFYKQPMYYALGHFSKFIPPGSRRIENNVTPARPLSVLTVLRPDNSTTVVVLNKNSHDVKLTIVDSEKGNALLNIPKQSICSVIYR